MKNKFKNVLLQVFGTKIGWFFLCLFFWALCFAFSSNSTFIDNGPKWLNTLGWIFLIYPAIIVIIMFVYGIKNTYLSIKNNKK